MIGSLAAMFLIYQGVEGSPFVSVGESMMGMFIMSLGQFADFYDTFVDTKYPTMATVNQHCCLMFCFCVCVCFFFYPLDTHIDVFCCLMFCVFWCVFYTLTCTIMCFVV